MDAAGLLPPGFVERLRAVVPPDRLDEALASFSAAKPASFRVNTLRGTPDAAVAELSEAGLTPAPVPWCTEAFTVPAGQRDALVRCAAVNDGRVYVQGLSSVLAGLVLGPRPGEAVLDLAAAPGGKTLHLAALMRGRGAISAVEPVRDRFFRLKANLECAGVLGTPDAMVRLFQADGRTVGRKTPGRFDRVLIDAPCSSEARFRADDPETHRYWSTKKVAECARKQKALLRSAVDACRVGGRVLYCTCALSPEENEAVVAHTLRRLGDAVALLPIGLPVGHAIDGLASWAGRSFDPALAQSRRVLPTDRMDAFYLALLEKRRG